MIKLLPEGEKKPWLPLIVRQGSDLARETNNRISEMTALYNSGDQGKEKCKKLDFLGNLLSEALKSTGLNPTQFADLAGIAERKMLFASTGLLKPEEFLEEDFLAKVDKGFKKYYGIDINLGEEASRLLSSGE